MANFVILGGSETQVSSWWSVQTLLARRGHQCVVADWSDLPWNSGVPDAIATLASKLSTVSNCILVGHSIAGLILPLLGDYLNAKGEMYLAALMPRCASSFLDRLFRGEEIFNEEWLSNYDALVNSRLSREAQEQILFQHLFHDCPPASASLWKRSTLPLQELYEFTCPRIADRPRRAIICAEDRSVLPTWQHLSSREICQSEAVVASGHCAHISQPKKLAELMGSFAAELRAV